MHVGQRIRNLRLERGISAQALAERLKRGMQTVYRWEWGAVSPRMEDLKLVADALGVELPELLQGVTDGAPSSPPASPA